VRSSTGAHAARVDGQEVLQVCPEGEVRFVLPRGARKLRARYGIVPEAYAVGRSDGVYFAVECLAPTGEAVLLWHRYLDPRQTAADRGTHDLELDLPAECGGGRLLLRTSDLPGKQPLWDWSYWTAVEIR
jgi:hypothetical protein